MRLKEYILSDGIMYYPFLSKNYILDWILRGEGYWIRRYMKALRSEEYYTFIRPNKLLQYYYRRKKNILGSRLGFIIHAGNFGLGLRIYHYGSIIVHPQARIGADCVIHGNCCIGSDGGYPDIPPVIGDNVDIGQGAQILGNITVANGVKIGAGAVVVKSIQEEGVTVVGVPAKIIKKGQ